MKIVTDSGADIDFEECQKLGVHMLPLKVEVDGISYQSGVDITPARFYELMDNAENMPKTSTPSIGDFQKLYEELAKEDSEIISIHLSSGLSGTYNTALQAAKSIKNATIDLIDTLTLSAGTAWHVRAAVEMVKNGLSRETILAKLQQIRDASYTFFTLPDLKYLIAGGRISHLKGLLASLLGIKPIIEVDKNDGKYYDRSKKRSFLKAIQGIPELLLKRFPEGTRLRVQICSAENPEGTAMLKAAMEQYFMCEWLPVASLGTALGAHTGKGLIGAVVAAVQDLPTLV